MSFIDSLGAGLTSGSTTKEIKLLKDSSQKFLHRQMGIEFDKELKVLDLTIDDKKFGIHPFYITRGKLF